MKNITALNYSDVLNSGKWESNGLGGSSHCYFHRDFLCDKYFSRFDITSVRARTSSITLNGATSRSGETQTTGCPTGAGEPGRRGRSLAVRLRFPDVAAAAARACRASPRLRRTQKCVSAPEGRDKCLRECDDFVVVSKR